MKIRLGGISDDTVIRKRVIFIRRFAYRRAATHKEIQNACRAYTGCRNQAEVRTYLRTTSGTFQCVICTFKIGGEKMQGYTDKEILGDGLSTQKATTDLFNTASNECVHDNVRSTMLKILEQEHSIQNEVFNMMHARGYYETPAAEEKKIEDAKQKFAQGYK